MLTVAQSLRLMCCGCCVGQRDCVLFPVIGRCFFASIATRYPFAQHTGAVVYQMSAIFRIKWHHENRNKYKSLLASEENNKQLISVDFHLAGSYLRATGEERFDVDVGVVDFEVVVTEPAGHTDGGQHPCLENTDFSISLKKKKKKRKENLVSVYFAKNEHMAIDILTDSDRDGSVSPCFLPVRIYNTSGWWSC